MVRGPAAVLGGAFAAQVWLLLAPVLPATGSRDAGLVVAGVIGLAAIVVCCAAVVPLFDHPPLLVLVLAGLGLLLGALTAAEAGPAASAVEAAVFGACGALFAVWLLTPALALALPLFVAAIELLAGGGAGLLAGLGEGRDGDALSLALPTLGGGLPAAHIGAAEAAFTGVFLAYARRTGLRAWGTGAAIWGALSAALVLEVASGVELPALAVITAAYFAANADRLRGLFERAAEG